MYFIKFIMRISSNIYKFGIGSAEMVHD